MILVAQADGIGSEPRRCELFCAIRAEVPNSLLWPVFILAALAAVIASQALISGHSHALIQQAMFISIIVYDELVS